MEDVPARYYLGRNLVKRSLGKTLVKKSLGGSLCRSPWPGEDPGEKILERTLENPGKEVE